MWTPAGRAQLARDACPYATSLTDAEWGTVAPFLPTPAMTDTTQSPSGEIMRDLRLLRSGAS